MNPVKLISVTQPTLPGFNTLEDYIAYVARVSNPHNQMNTQTSGKLLHYLMKHQHWSPFEMASICMEIRTTRDIARQLLRHRSFSFQEFSQRYAQSTLTEPREARMQDLRNRQSSLPCASQSLSEQWDEAQVRLMQHAYAVYDEFLSQGMAKEVVRAVLPEGLTESVLYMSGTVRSWLHYCQIRCGMETQKEHREIAIQCRKVLNELLPSLRLT